MAAEHQASGETDGIVSQLSPDELLSSIHDTRKLLPTISDEESHYHLPTNDINYQPNVHKNEPSGVVVCCRCGEGAMNSDEIAHSKDCDQKEYHSAYWWIHHKEQMLEWFQQHPRAARRWLSRR
jgi:hypothetical protein